MDIIDVERIDGDVIVSVRDGPTVRYSAALLQ
jgi:hypothetical protein